MAATDLGADVLTQVKLLPGKLASICFTLPVWMATATMITGTVATEKTARTGTLASLQKLYFSRK